MSMQRLILLIVGGVAVIAALVGIRMVGTPADSVSTQPVATTEDEGMSDLLDNGTFAIIKKNFPEFYADFATDIKAHKDLGIDDVAISNFATQRIATFRRENARYILNVSDRTASGLVEDYLRSMQEILARRGETGCARYANQGMLAFQGDPIVDALSPLLQEQAAHVMAALAEGKKRGDMPQTISSGDWTSFRQSLNQTEKGRAALAVLFEGGTASASICGALDTYMSSLLAYKGEGAAALRAEMAYGIIAN